MSLSLITCKLAVFQESLSVLKALKGCYWSLLWSLSTEGVEFCGKVVGVRKIDSIIRSLVNSRSLTSMVMDTA